MIADPQRVDELALAVHEAACLATRFRSKELSLKASLHDALRSVDIPVLANRFLARYCASNGLALDDKQFSREAHDRLALKLPALPPARDLSLRPADETCELQCINLDPRPA